MRHDSHQGAISISIGCADYKSRADFLSHPEIKKPDFTPSRRHSRLASNRSAASAISKSSRGPESNGTARRKNSTVKALFSSSGKASKASRSWAVWRLIFLGYPFPGFSARQQPDNPFRDIGEIRYASAQFLRPMIVGGSWLLPRASRRSSAGWSTRAPGPASGWRPRRQIRIPARSLCAAPGSAAPPSGWRS